MRILLTAGPTHEPIDAVRYIGNRSSGRMGAALAEAALRRQHEVTLIAGPVTVAMPQHCNRIDVQTAAEMSHAVAAQFPGHDLLIMVAAVADYRPKVVHPGKLPRSGTLTIECEPTEDILAAAGRIKRPDQRTVGFSLEAAGEIERARRKLIAKKLDLIVFNPTETMESAQIQPILLWPDGRQKTIPSTQKADFADILLERALALFL